jgi:hypothetical protein
VTQEALDTATPNWIEFLDEFRRLSPGLPPGLTADTRIEALIGADRVSKALVYAALHVLLYDPPLEVVEALVTLGDACDCRASRAWADAPQSDPLVAHETALKTMRTANVRLRPIMNADIPEMYASALDPRWSYKWKFRGATPTMEEFVAQLGAGILSQLVVERLADRRGIGLMSCYNARVDFGYAFVAMTRFAPAAGEVGSEMIEGGYLFLSFIFRNWGIRKLYAEVPGFNWELFEQAQGNFFQVEGTLRDHDYFDGKFWDHRIAALYREAWELEAIPLLSQLYLSL